MIFMQGAERWKHRQPQPTLNRLHYCPPPPAPGRRASSAQAASRLPLCAAPNDGAGRALQWVRITGGGTSGLVNK